MVMFVAFEWPIATAMSVVVEAWPEVAVTVAVTMAVSVVTMAISMVTWAAVTVVRLARVVVASKSPLKRQQPHNEGWQIKPKI